MDNQTFQRLKDVLSKHQVVGVIVGPNPSIDEMGAGLGLYLSLKQMGKQVVIACPTDPTVAISSLVAINKVQKTLGGTGADLTVSFPYKEGEIEKVSYTLENGKLNIVVKAGTAGLSFQEKDVQFNRGGGSAPTLLFTIGVPRLTDLGTLYNPEALKGAQIVNIDNKADNQGYGDIVVVSTKFSSVSEQVSDFLTLLEPQIELDVDSSQNLLSGISFATKDFQSPTTSYLAFEMAGILMKKGAQRAKAVQDTTPRPDSNRFFPPLPQQPVVQQSPVQQQPVQFTPIMQQPVQQPAQPFVQPQPMQGFQTQPFQAPQPVQPQPVAQQQNPAPQAPADWLTPKVYKGSTVL